MFQNILNKFLLLIGATLQKSLMDFFNDNFNKIYENTLKAANSVAQQLDTATEATKS